MKVGKDCIGKINFIICKLTEANNIEDMRSILKFKSIAKYKKDERKYPEIKYKISPKEIENIKKNGWINEKNEINFNKFKDGNSLEKLLIALIWKNGDLLKIRHIIEGIIDVENINRQYVTFFNFGKYLKNPENEIIVDQHVIRAYAVIKVIVNNNENSELQRIDVKNRNSLTNKDQKLIDEYKTWILHNTIINSKIIRTKEYENLLDDILFATGKMIKNTA